MEHCVRTSVMLVCVAALALMGCQREEPAVTAEAEQPQIEEKPAAWIDDERLGNADSEPHHWLVHITNCCGCHRQRHNQSKQKKWNKNMIKLVLVRLNQLL